MVLLMTPAHTCAFRSWEQNQGAQAEPIHLASLALIAQDFLMTDAGTFFFFPVNETNATKFTHTSIY